MRISNWSLLYQAVVEGGVLRLQNRGYVRQLFPNVTISSSVHSTLCQNWRSVDLIKSCCVHSEGSAQLQTKPLSSAKNTSCNRRSHELSGIADKRERCTSIRLLQTHHRGTITLLPSNVYPRGLWDIHSVLRSNNASDSNTDATPNSVSIIFCDCRGRCYHCAAWSPLL